MCTVTFVPTAGGYRLGMNRDERHARAAGLPPAVRDLEGRVAVFPSEPGGGTWIAVNERRAAFALVNWYPLARVRAFRLLGVFPAARALLEWAWDGRRLRCASHGWDVRQWASSGYDEPGAQRSRGAVLRRALAAPSAGSCDWLRRLHRSHRPVRGAHSTCVHRADAGTVSYTEVEVEARRVRVGYVAGPPCRGTQPVGVEIGCDDGTAQWAARSTTPQAMRSPALPAGSVR